MLKPFVRAEPRVNAMPPYGEFALLFSPDQGIGPGVRFRLSPPPIEGSDLSAGPDLQRHGGLNMRIASLLAGAALLAAVAAPASAKVMTATYTGVVGPMTDGGDFGSWGDYAWTGTSFTAVYTYDTSQGSRYTDPYIDILFDPVSITSATLSLGLMKYEFATAAPLPGKVGTAEIDRTGIPYEAFSFSHTTPTPTYQIDLNLKGFSGGLPYDLETPWSGPVTTPDAYTEEDAFHLIYSSPTVNHYSWGALVPQWLTIAEVDTTGGGGGGGEPAPGVPEPSSWILLLAGFGGLGAVLRRRFRRRAASRSTLVA
jgi:hypothetical protein